LLIAFLAVIALIVLVPLLLDMLVPRLFIDDMLSWAWFLFWPVLLTVLLNISVVVGLVAFAVAKARLPDRPWRSAQTLAIVLPFTAIVLATPTVGWRLHTMDDAPEIGPRQRGLPSLHLARTSGGSGRFSWSADGEWLATYGAAGIIMSTPDGKYKKEFPLHTGVLGHYVLGFLSGHRLLITSPARQDNNSETTGNLNPIAFSVIDAESGKILHNISGPHPDGLARDNTATDLAVSPDERFVAAICGHPRPQIEIYSTIDWKPIGTLNLRTSERDDTPRRLAFSPDGKMLAVIELFSGRIKFFQVGSWILSGSLVAYPDEVRPTHSALLEALAFSPDSAMIAVGSYQGGSRWTHPNGIFGSGEFRHEFPADPLRVYRVANGSGVATLGSFPGGLHRSALVWSPNGEYLAFQDQAGDIRFWNPLQSDLSVAVARKGAIYGTLLFSRDGSQFAANFPDGVKVFDVVPPH
jgi:WD40 repeat protein